MQQLKFCPWIFLLQCSPVARFFFFALICRNADHINSSVSNPFSQKYVYTFFWLCYFSWDKGLWSIATSLPLVFSRGKFLNFYISCTDILRSCNEKRIDQPAKFWSIYIDKKISKCSYSFKVYLGNSLALFFPRSLRF